MYDKNNTEQLYAKQKYFAVQIICLGLINGLTFFLNVFIFRELMSNQRLQICNLEIGLKSSEKKIDKNAFLGEKTKVESQNSKLSSMRTFFFSKK